MSLPGVGGERDLILMLPPILLTDPNMQVAPAAGGVATVRLAEARIRDSTDSQYGSIGWIPRLDGKPFAYIEASEQGLTERVVETMRVRTTLPVSVFIVVAETDAPPLTINLIDQAAAWRAALRQTIPANRRLYPASTTYWATAGDVRWETLGAAGKIQARKEIQGIAYYGAEVKTLISWTTLVTYQG